MTALQLIDRVDEIVFFFIAVSTAVRAIQKGTVASAMTAAFFGFVTIALVAGPLIETMDPALRPTLQTVRTLLALPIPLLLVLQAAEFRAVRQVSVRAGLIGFVAAAILVLATTPPRPAVVTIVVVGYFIVLFLYSAGAFVREGSRSHGITKRRMRAIASASYLIGAAVFFATLPEFFRGLRDVATALMSLSVLGAGIGYALGFAPPTALRRYWQEPELRRFLQQAATLPRLPSTTAIIEEIERSTAAAFGASRAAVVLWDAGAQVLRAERDGDDIEVPTHDTIAGRAFLEQRAVHALDAARDNPNRADAYRQRGIVSLLAAPITAGDQRLGALVVYSSARPVFEEDDLVLVELLANQAAVILESRALIDEATRVRAREEATRLKDDFLSAAAHDLRTPLTALMAQAQLLERRLAREPERAPDADAARRMVGETRRLSEVVNELLDASRAEQRKLVSDERSPVDLVEVIRELTEKLAPLRHRAVVEANGPTVGNYDRNRIMQLAQNLLENAVKYSPGSAPIQVRLWREGAMNRLSVRDRGIGIPPEDMPRVFERFHRGTNVDDRRFAGMGLGLFITRAIAEAHGGRIWAESVLGEGSTFHVALPAREEVNGG